MTRIVFLFIKSVWWCRMYIILILMPAAHACLLPCIYLNFDAMAPQGRLEKRASLWFESISVLTLIVHNRNRPSSVWDRLWAAHGHPSSHPSGPQLWRRYSWASCRRTSTCWGRSVTPCWRLLTVWRRGRYWQESSEIFIGMSENRGGPICVFNNKKGLRPQFRHPYFETSRYILGKIIRYIFWWFASPTVCADRAFKYVSSTKGQPKYIICVEM